MNRIADHIYNHPFRLLTVSLVAAVLSWSLAGAAILLAFDSSHGRDVAICRSINELRNELYIAAVDLGVNPVVRDRFRPTQDCEALP